MAGNAQHMTSLEIAELTGKQHKNLMRDIRNMEPAWEKITGLKFELCEKTYMMANGVEKSQPFYQLTKRECLYIATKFNDEARARLVLRWEQLEHERCQQGAVRKLLVSDMDVIKESENIMGRELEILNGDPKDYITTTEIAKAYGLEPGDLISFLRDKKVLMPRGRQRLTSQYAESGLAENRHCRYYSLKGELKESIYLVWTEKGRDFINNIINKYN
jgi:phage regulator Rha-like protein